jgi:hypothetical protein
MGEEMTSKQLLDKCIAVIWSCNTETQLNGAVKFCENALRSPITQNGQLNRMKFIISVERGLAITSYRIMRDKNES